MRDTVTSLKQVQFREKLEHFLINGLAVTGAVSYNITQDPDGVKLFTNGFQDFKLLIRGTGEDIPTFNIDVYYKRGGVGQEASIGAKTTIVVPAITKDVGWVAVDLVLNSAQLQLSEYIDLVFDLPAPTTAAYNVSMMMLKIATLDYAFGVNGAGISSGSSSSSGLDGIYSVANGDYNVTVAGSNKIAKIVNPGFTVEANNIVYAFLRDSAGERSILPLSTISVAASGSDYDVTFTDKESNFAATDVVEIYTAGPEKGLDKRVGAYRAQIINSDHLQKLELFGFIDVTNVAAATYREIINFKGRDNATINVICSGGVTVDIFGTNNQAADDTADTGWVSLSATSIIDTTDGWVITGQEPWDRIMIKYVTSDASNALEVDCVIGG